MKIKISTKKFRLTQDVNDRVNQKLDKLAKFFPEDNDCIVNIMTQKNDVRVEITIPSRGAIFRSEVSDKDYLCALDRAQENILRQIRKNRTRLEKRKYIPKDTGYIPEPDVQEDEDEVRIRKIKSFRVDPMTPEEAVLQMNLLSHQFFAFRNAETGNIGVVYLRSDGSYGVIDCVD